MAFSRRSSLDEQQLKAVVRYGLDRFSAFPSGLSGFVAWLIPRSPWARAHDYTLSPLRGWSLSKKAQRRKAQAD